MVLQNDVQLPSKEELTVKQELDVSSPALRAAAYHMGKYCDNVSKEFMLCRSEFEDPRKCLKEGRDVTACGVEFLRMVKKACIEEFNRYMNCVDTASGELFLAPCRKTQRIFDRCMFDHYGMERPPLGYFSKPRVHITDRPKPPNNDYPDYQAEAAKVIDQLPADYPYRQDFKKYYDPQLNPFA
ncbi:NADH:ubiquinone dehydrogenase [Trichuris trichiura]|uniref:NADH dehydrogenase [ubiquinone] 1 alpha subcomplex subunit 8 n=1 Tax=Trichuris trichiura TaxID=36087 RepID=A0A077ZKF4_TRITR|nr:NADH:ubiquinone dehydrogenase [Trichuris trichiura]